MGNQPATKPPGSKPPIGGKLNQTSRGSYVSDPFGNQRFWRAQKWEPVFNNSTRKHRGRGLQQLASDFFFVSADHSVWRPLRVVLEAKRRPFVWRIQYQGNASSSLGFRAPMFVSRRILGSSSGAKKTTRRRLLARSSEQRMCRCFSGVSCQLMLPRD